LVNPRRLILIAQHGWCAGRRELGERGGWLRWGC
jgi:hypothetical protein